MQHRVRAQAIVVCIDKRRLLFSKLAVSTHWGRNSAASVSAVAARRCCRHIATIGVDLKRHWRESARGKSGATASYFFNHLNNARASAIGNALPVVGYLYCCDATSQRYGASREEHWRVPSGCLTSRTNRKWWWKRWLCLAKVAHRAHRGGNCASASVGQRHTSGC